MREHHCIFIVIPPNLPIVHHIDYVMPRTDCMTWYKIVMQGFLMIYHRISHLSLVFSLHTHSPEGSCVYEENTSDSWDILQYTTQKH